jgi:hypothetical protein
MGRGLGENELLEMQTELLEARIDTLSKQLEDLSLAQKSEQ